jgi:hypothetical protein
VATNDRTRTSITSTIMPALGWLTSPAAAAAATPGRSLDVGELLESRATVFLLGAEETQGAPLVCALTGHIAREARRLAAVQPGGRLDPNLTLVLDEAALVSPVPLESWTADMGGRGVTIIAAFQSRAQLLARWGEHAAATILNNTAAVMIFGGTRDRDDLLFWSTLTGDRDERVTSHDLHGRGATRTVRKVPVLAPAQIANLPAGKVLVIRRGLAPVVGRVQPAWRRRDVRRHQQRLAATLAAISSPRALGELEEPRALDQVPAGDKLLDEVPPADPWDIPDDWFTHPGAADRADSADGTPHNTHTGAQNGATDRTEDGHGDQRDPGDRADHGNDGDDGESGRWWDR